MVDEHLTSRDREYIQMILMLDGVEDPVSPSKLAENMEVSRVAALKKMKRLASIGLGNYIPNQGMILNDESKDILRDTSRRHHIVEKYLQESLDLAQEKACKEAVKIASLLGDESIENMYSSINDPICDCGYRIGDELEVGTLKRCHWLDERIKGGRR